MNTVIACGGTGGHLFPGLAVAEVLRSRGHEVMLFVSEKEIDTLALSGREEFRFQKLPTVGLPSPFSPKIFGFLGRFSESIRVCRSVYRKFKPHAVLGMGGYTSTAPVLAGKMRGIPTFIHESNAIPGKANRVTARMVRAVLLGFKECAPFFPTARTEVTGTPIRKELAPMDKKMARQKLGLREDLTTLLVMGGSQGATGDPSHREPRRTARGRQLPAGKNPRARRGVPSRDGGSLQRGRSRHRAFRRCEPR
jgi:UDP-N-acetylglucosamine--N-acetylmuramyl-(pentapeptide) pyrophosphoryl-undecaprenol N-acetylglucosamine transferase